jgi:hypothetical protein
MGFGTTKTLAFVVQVFAGKNLEQSYFFVAPNSVILCTSKNGVFLE